MKKGRKSLTVFLCMLILFLAICSSILLDSAQTQAFIAHPSPQFNLSDAEIHPFQNVSHNRVHRFGAGVSSNILQFKSGGHVVGFQRNKAYFAGLDHALSVEFLCTPGVMPKSTAFAQGAGNTSSKALSLNKIVYRNLWKGISLTYEPTKSGIAESTYYIAPGADVSRIRLHYNVPVETQTDGSIKLAFASGYLTESAPVAWQERGGKRELVEVSFMISRGEVGFRVAKYNHNFPLTIDPTYVWHTFYGSNAGAAATGIALDGSGNIYITGTSYATWNGPSGQAPLNNNGGIFVLKLDPNGAYQWHTFLGATYAIVGIALDGNGSIYITGSSGATWNGPSGQLPLNPFSSSPSYGSNVFILKLTIAGAYQWHTFYGTSLGNGSEGFGIAADGSGNVYVTGSSGTTWNGPSGQSPLNPSSGNGGIFVLKLNTSGAYQWHTFYGMGSIDSGWDIAVDGGGNSYIAGRSEETWNGPSGQPPLNSTEITPDNPESGGIFALKLDTNGTYQWHTFYGSSNNDVGNGIALDTNGGVYVSGISRDWNGPSGQAPLNNNNVLNNNNSGIFVLKLNTRGTYQWHTFYGNGEGLGTAVDGNGNVYITGQSGGTWNGPSGQSPLNPFSNNYYYPGGNAFILKLNSSGSYQWHTFYGELTMGYGITLNSIEDIYVAGSSFANWDGPSGPSPLDPFTGTYYPGTPVSNKTNIFVLKMSQIQPGNPHISVSPSSINFGSVKSGSMSTQKAITLKNTGKGSLIIDSINIIGTEANDFVQTNACKVLSPKSSCTINVTFSSTLPFGKKSADIGITSNDIKNPTVNVKLSGQTDPPKISVSPMALNFTPLQVGNSSLPKKITIKNTGISDLVINNITITGSNAGDFSQTNSCSVIPKGISCTVHVTFVPDLPAAKKSATLGISSNDPKNANVTVKLSGTGK